MENIIQNKHLDSIYQTLSGLNLMELNQVMTKVVGLRRKKLSTVLSQTETKLLKKINKGLPLDIQNRYDYLIEKKDNETISDKEHEELLELIAYSEDFNVKRLKHITELAKIKNKTYDQIIEELDLKDIVNVA